MTEEDRERDDDREPEADDFPLDPQETARRSADSDPTTSQAVLDLDQEDWGA